MLLTYVNQFKAILKLLVDSSLLNDNFCRTYITNDKFLLLERQL